MTLSDWELWACAAEVARIHGDQAPAAIATRIGELALKGDLDGVAAWKAIAARILELEPPATGASH